jgi:hypothetical protein
MAEFYNRLNSLKSFYGHHYYSLAYNQWLKQMEELRLQEQEGGGDSGFDAYV